MQLFSEMFAIVSEFSHKMLTMTIIFKTRRTSISVTQCKEQRAISIACNQAQSSNGLSLVNCN